MTAIISHDIALKELGKGGCPGGGEIMQYDGLIWKPPMKDGLIADPISMAKILWTIQQTWYLVSVYDPEDKEFFDPTMEYFIDIGLFDTPITLNLEITAKLLIKHRCIYDIILVKPNDLETFIFMIAYSDFAGLQIRSADKNDASHIINLWRNIEGLTFDSGKDFLGHVSAMKKLSTINILWGLPNWDCLRNALVISEDEKILYRMKAIIEQYKQDHHQQDDEEYDHQVMLCNVEEEILKWPHSDDHI